MVIIDRILKYNREGSWTPHHQPLVLLCASEAVQVHFHDAYSISSPAAQGWLDSALGTMNLKSHALSSRKASAMRNPCQRDKMNRRYRTKSGEAGFTGFVLNRTFTIDARWKAKGFCRTFGCKASEQRYLAREDT